MGPVDRSRFVCAVGACLALLGCSRGPVLPDGAVQVHPVSGTLNYKGAPMVGAQVSFRSTSDGGKLAPAATADENGKYALTTYVTGDGAPAGEYTVTIYWPGEQRGKQPSSAEFDPSPPPDRLKRAYADPKTTKLRATVRTEPNTIDFTLP